MTTDLAAPRPVRVAGLLVGLQGLTAVAVCVALLVTAVRGSLLLSLTLATAVTFAVIGATLIAVGLNLNRGRHGARSPAVVTQLLLLGVAWYALGPSNQPVYGIGGALFCITVLVLLFSPAAVRWATAPAPLSNHERDATDR